MTGFLKSIFYPQDGSRKQVKDAVTASRESVERAASRFEATVRDLLHRNDQVTGRNEIHDEERT